MTTPSSQSLGAIAAAVQHFVPVHFGGRLLGGTHITQLNFKTLAAAEQEQNLILFRKEAWYMSYHCADTYQGCDFNRLLVLNIWKSKKNRSRGLFYLQFVQGSLPAYCTHT